MKLKPHQHRQAAQHLKKLAELAADPQQKQRLLNKANLGDALAKAAARRARQAKFAVWFIRGPQASE
jgi:hypothetical protein